MEYEGSSSGRTQLSATKEIGKTLYGFVPWILAIAGIGATLVGLLTGNLALIGAGVVLIVLVQVVHRSVRKQFLRDLEVWAVQGLGGLGPIPPASVRVALFQAALAQGGDHMQRYQFMCRAWAAEQRDRV